MNKRKSLNESDRRTIERGVRRVVALVIFALLFAIFSHLLAGCQKETTPIVYKFETESLVWQTNPENPRQKIPVVKDMTYFLVGELK